jgi:predicted lipoprotein
MYVMNKIFKYGIVIVTTVLVIFLSLDIQKLDEVKTGNADSNINPDDYAISFWKNELPGCIEKAINADNLINLLKTDPQKAINEYSHQLGISHTYYFILKGSGKIISVEEEYLIVETDEKNKVQIATSFIFGNAVRDASGKVDIDDFINMTAFNNVSVAINKLVKDQVVEGLKALARPEMLLQFAGATEISEEDMNPDAVRIIPVSINFMDGKTE